MLHQSRIRILVVLAAVAAVTAGLMFVHAPARAHGDLEFGDYVLEIGFLTEPALVGQPNGLDLIVTNHDTGEGVNGLADSLHAEIIYGSQSLELPLRPREAGDGAYTADVIPTEPGEYTWHIWGNIEGTEVDAELASGPNSFSDVEMPTAYAFPYPLATARELQQQVQTALYVGVVGATFGVISLVLAIMVTIRKDRG
jgi:hypothetical protein